MGAQYALCNSTQALGRVKKTTEAIEAADIKIRCSALRLNLIIQHSLSQKRVFAANQGRICIPCKGPQICAAERINDALSGAPVKVRTGRNAPSVGHWMYILKKGHQST